MKCAFALVVTFTTFFAGLCVGNDLGFGFPFNDSDYLDSQKEGTTSPIQAYDEEIQLLDWLEPVLDCNEDEICDSDCGETTVTVANQSAPSPCYLSRKQKAEDCRCDYPKCLDYGDCCWNVVVGVSKQPRRNLQPYLECSSLFESALQVWMVSKCRPGSDQTLTTLCAVNTAEVPDIYQIYSYHVDLPVYSEVTHTLYKNVFCAQCHGEENSALVQWHTHLKCNVSMTADQRNAFVDNATYKESTRTFVYDGILCQLLIDELNSISSQSVKENEPNFRLCVPTAPVANCTKNSRDTVYCNSYTQYVASGGRTFKNMHCAKCILESEQLRNAGQKSTFDSKNYNCYKPLNNILRTALPGSGSLGVLFDFSLDDSNQLVGYRTRCKNHELWDYLHQRCQIGLCGPGFVFRNGDCHSFGNVHSDNGSGSSQDNFHGEVEIHRMNSTLKSDCRRILLFPGEYQFVSEQNASIIVNGSARAANGKAHVFSPKSYARVNESVLMICDDDSEIKYFEKFPLSLLYVSTVCLAASVICSFLHLFIYISLPKLQNLPGKILACLALCILSSQLVFVTLINHSKWSELCVLVSIFLHYTFLASFFWMNVMSFDIWRTFTGTMVSSRNQSFQGRQVTFFKYSLFAWLAPLVIVVSAAMADFLPPALFPELRRGPWTKSWEVEIQLTPSSYSSYNETDAEQSMADSIVHFLHTIKPSYGQNGVCWFRQSLSLFLFFGVPVALVIASNLILFAFTARAILIQHRVSERIFNSTESRKRSKKMAAGGNTTSIPKNSSTVSAASSAASGGHHDEINVKLYAKLALIMGLTWILGFVSNASEVSWMWFLFVILNGLQGTFIFFAFDCKKKIFYMLKERWITSTFIGRCFNKEEFRPRATSDSTKTTTSTYYTRTLSVDKKTNLAV